ncbi:MAG: NAD(P)/FAD-dependent oxidoreductase [Lachnospiraceae bacterium]|jgi:glycerol-3-phosphate dehydrogenase
MNCDVAIIGAGISGCAMAYELSKYDIKTVLIEKENDVSVGTTKANSAILHAGFDPEPGSLMAKYNVEGNAYTKELCRKLDVPMKEIGSLVVAFDESERSQIEELYERGLKNGVPGLEIWEAARLRKEEPEISENAVCALFAPSAAIVSPWELAIALAETAVRNGVCVKLNTKVTSISKISNGGFIIDAVREDTGRAERINAGFICNAAGVFADSINDMVNDAHFTIKPNKGEYYLLDKSQGGLVKHVIFRCPGKNGKGVLISPTVHGNLIAGPNSENCGPEDVSTTYTGLAEVMSEARNSVPRINFRENIRNFAGVRARTDRHDFYFYEDEKNKGFVNIAGMASPGLTSAAAIARDAVGLFERSGLELRKKENYIDTRKIVRFRELDEAERAEAVKKNPLYGRVICRCETVTQGEIIDALNRPIPAVSVDGVKRRCGAGMGRCQGGFCGPKVLEIIAEHTGIPMEDIPKDRLGSYILSR